MSLFPLLLFVARSFFAPRLELMAEVLALRQQLAILNRTAKRPSLRFQDRLFWVSLARLWQDWRSALPIVKPETVIKWDCQGFRRYWRWKSEARRPGSPRIDTEIRALIRRLSQENPLWIAPRIQSELRLLGFDLAESTVAKYRVRGSASPSQTWKTFRANHAKQIAAIDFFTVPTLTFRNLYGFIILLHDRRQVIHFQQRRLDGRRDDLAQRAG
jgi:putative transposase